MGKACSTYGTWRGAYRVLMGKPEGRRPFGRSLRRLEDNIKMDLREWDGCMDCIDLAQDRDWCLALVNAVMNFWVPYKAGNSLIN
jgi:hypothetical protein